MEKIDLERLVQNVMRLSKHLHDVLNFIWDTQDYVDQPNRFFYTMFVKLYFTLDAIHIQIANLDNKPHYSIPAVLALRTCMLDILNVYYVMDVTKKDGERELRINAIMADHLKYSFREFTQQQKDETCRDWPELFEADGTPKKFLHLTSKQMAEAITEFPTLKREADEIQHIYSIFSKYEHNGLFTYDLIHNPYFPGGNQNVKFFIKSAINSCAIAFKLLSLIWLNPEDQLIVKLNSIVEDFFLKRD